MEQANKRILTENVVRSTNDIPCNLCNDKGCNMCKNTPQGFITSEVRNHPFLNSGGYRTRR